jgi:hypothetical protein
LLIQGIGRIIALLDYPCRRWPEDDYHLSEVMTVRIVLN